MLSTNFEDILNGKKGVMIGEALPCGKHSFPVIIKEGKNKFVLKKSSLGKGLILKQAKLMVKSLKKYNSNLSSCGINISKIYLAKALPDHSYQGRYFVASLEEFMGRSNASDLLKKSSRKKAIIIYHKILTEVCKALKVKSKKGSLFAGALIDSKPKNYVLSKKGKMTFIDFYTPKLLDSKGTLYPYFPNLHPTRSLRELQIRFEEKNALIHILLAHSIADCPNFRKNFEEDTIKYLKKIGENSVAEYIQNASKNDYIRPDIIKEETINEIKKL